MKNVIIILLCIAQSVTAQLIRGPIGISPTGAMGVQDGIYIEENIPTKKVIQYNHIREADVAWSKRVWSVIDLREKINQPLYYPTDDIQLGMWNRNTNIWSMWTLIRQHVINGDLTVYSPFNPEWEKWQDGDSFKYPIVSKKAGGNYYNDAEFQSELFMYLGAEIIDPFAVPFKSYLDPTIDSTIILADGTEQVVYPPNDTSWFLSQDIVQYKLKEDWFFNKETSTVERRIIGIAPIVYSKDVNGNIIGIRELFWLYFPQCRYVFQNYFVASRHNDAQLMSLDDLFWKRKFHSYVLKESNMYDRPIEEYKAGVDALLEANQIKSHINNFEHDLWEY